MVFGSTEIWDDRLGELDGLEDHRLIRIAEGVAGEGLLEADGRGDVAGGDELDVLAMVRVEQDDTGDALLAVLRRVVDGISGVERAGVDPEECELAAERVGGDLERERSEWVVLVRATDELLTGLRIGAHDRGDLERRRKVGDDRVEERLHGLVPEGRPTEHRDDLPGDRRDAERGNELLGGDRLAFEVLVEQAVIGLGDLLDQQLVGGGRGGPVLLGDLLHDPVGRGVALPEQGLHLDDVDDPDEVGFGAHRQLDRHRVRAQAVDDHVEAPLEARPHAVHFVSRSRCAGPRTCRPGATPSRTAARPRRPRRTP